MQRLGLRIEGRVQGVGFRWFVLGESQRLGLAGYVKNNSDGSVEVVAEGAEVALAQLEQSCRRGPQSAHVKKVERTAENAAKPLYTSFEIR